jgi:hypothetical protein
MSALWKSLIVVGVLVAVCVGALVLSAELYHRIGPPAQERRAREVTIQPLLQSHATREQVVQSLGLKFVDYSVGSPNQKWLEPAPERVRQGAGRYPGVLFHTTADTMTWLFFDADGRLQEYYLCEQ